MQPLRVVRGGPLLGLAIVSIAPRCLLLRYGYILEKTRFLARSMKTKDLFWRCPRKISLLKDLGGERFLNSLAL